MRNIFKEETIRKINKLDQDKFFKKIYDYRWERYKDTRNFDKYGNGWKNRLDKFKK
jgi:lysozyme family protein